MSNFDHRPGVKEVNLVVRHLKLEVSDRETMNSVVEDIDQIVGLDGVSFDPSSKVLNIAYDATKVCMDCIEEVLEKHNVNVSHDWWTHFKEGYYRFVDQNIKDNASHEPWSCHSPSQRKR